MSTGVPNASDLRAALPHASRLWLLGIAGAAVGVSLLVGQGVAGRAQPDAGVSIDPLAARVARLEAALADAQDAARRAEARAMLTQGDRFISAALLLQSAIATPRPWLREYEAMAVLAPPGALPAPLAEVLLSHAARGLPTEAELRERFMVLAPQLAARAPRQGDAVDQTFTAMRSVAAGIGLAAPPAPSDQEQAIAGVALQLRRGNLAAAVADASALAPRLQPLLAGWVAQASARLAVEQAVQETLLRALAVQARPA